MCEELKPCPFCKGSRISLYVAYRTRALTKSPVYYARCCDCKAHSKKYTYKEDVIKAWNNRPIEDELNRQIAELKSDKEDALYIAREQENFHVSANMKLSDAQMELEQLRAETERLRAVMTPRPISEAPRDGTRILVVFRQDGFNYYKGEYKVVKYIYDGWSFIGVGGIPDESIECWYQLPPAPRIKEK